MTAADELRAAATEMRRLPGPAAQPIAKLLLDISAFHEHDNRPDHGGCDWCGDEDWPCNDVRNALAVARAINGSTPSDAGPQPAAADVEHCVHDRAVHTRHHHTPVTGCPWCAASVEARP